MNKVKRNIKARRVKEARKKAKLNRLVTSIENTYTANVNEFELMFLTPCIYFLFQDDKIVYIGETTAAMTRISQHAKNHKKQFNRFSIEPFNGSTKERKNKERLLITKFKPVYNVQHASDKELNLYTD